MRRVSGERERQRVVTPTFLLLTLGTFAYFVSVGISLPVLPLFVRGPLGGTNIGVGIVSGAFAVSAVLLRPVVGRLGDKRGRRLLIVLGGALAAVSIGGYALASGLSFLVAMRVLNGVGEAFLYTGAASAINDIAPEDRRGEAVSFFTTAVFVGLIVGPFLGETLLHHGGFTVTWATAAAAAGMAAVVGIVTPETLPLDARRESESRLIHPAAVRPGIVVAASVVGFAGFSTFVPLYALELGLGGSRFVFALYAGVILVVRSLGARIPDRVGLRRTTGISLVISIVGLVVMGAWASVAGLVCGAVLLALGQSLAFPALMSMAVVAAPEAERGAAIGTFTAFVDAGFGIGPVTLGVVAAVFGYRAVFIGAAMVVAGGLAVLLYQRHRSVRSPA